MTNNGGTAAESATEIAARVANSQNEEAKSVTFSNGIRLRLRPVNRLLLNQAAASIPTPEPPMVDIGKGRREPFPDDENYQLELAQLAVKRMQVGGYAAIAMGTSVEFVPEGLDRPDDDGWIEDIRRLDEISLAAGGKPTELNLGNATERYISWLNCYAITTEADQYALSAALMRQMGVTLEEVAESMATFPSGAGRDAAEPVPPAPSGANGNNRAARRRRPRPAAG